MTFKHEISIRPFNTTIWIFIGPTEIAAHIGVSIVYTRLFV